MATNTAPTERDAALECLRSALNLQRSFLTAYEHPCDPVAYETLRAFDDLFCNELMDPTQKVAPSERAMRSIASWGVNHALRRVIPKSLQRKPFQDYPSGAAIQSKANDFIWNCGLLSVAERFEGWLSEGLVTGELRPFPKPEHVENVLILRCAADSCYDEKIGMSGLRWASDLVWREDRQTEMSLENRHRQIEPELQRSTALVDGWRIKYSSTHQIEDYFLDWAKLYLRRMFSQDMIGLDDLIGGRPFSRYLDLLYALSARSQKHIAFAAIIKARHPTVGIRNLLTTHCPRRLFVESLAGYMGADFSEVESILSSFTLSGNNLSAHTGGSETTWAPIVQASTDTLILPTYGIDINPFLFLLTDLIHSPDDTV